MTLFFATGWRFSVPSVPSPRMTPSPPVRLQRFDQAKPFLTLGVVALAWILVPGAIKRLVRASFFELQAPVEVAASDVRDLQQFWALKTKSKNELIQAGIELSGVLGKYQLTVAQEEQQAATIARLQALLNLPEEPGWHYERAEVSLRDNSAFWQQLTIRKGRNYGIQPNAPVVFAGGVVGQVRKVGLYESTVELISSPGVRLAAVLEGDARPVSYQGGENPTLGPSRGRAEFLPADLKLAPGTPRRLMTSGLGGEFPANLIIGELTRLSSSADGMFQNGEVLLDRRLAELQEVTVLIRNPDGPASAIAPLPSRPSP